MTIPYDLTGIWYFLAAATRLVVDSSFALFVAVLGLVLIWRARGAVALRGLMWAGAAAMLWGLTSALADLTWFFTDYAGLRGLLAGALGSGPVTLGAMAIAALGYLVDALCLGMGVLGLASVARRLAATRPTTTAASAEPSSHVDLEEPLPSAEVPMPAALTDEADPTGEMTDADLGLSVVASA